MPNPLPPHAGHGWLIVDKPASLSSAQVVGKVKHMFRQAGLKLSKIGHAGTLDPAATGVLPLALGEATKTVSFMLDADKAYEFSLVFGAQTTTDDAEGGIVATSPHRPTHAQLEAVLPRFMGAISQMPPAVSALKVGGERAYAMVRRGETPTLVARNVVVHGLALLAYDGQTAHLSAHVSKGTYIRSLARDMAVALQTVGHVGTLRRTVHGPFNLTHAITLETLDNCLKSGQTPPILSVERALHGLVAVSASSEQAAALRQGKTLSQTGWPAGLAYACEQGVLVAMVQTEANGTAHPKRVFCLPQETRTKE